MTDLIAYQYTFVKEVQKIVMRYALIYADHPDYQEEWKP